LKFKYISLVGSGELGEENRGRVAIYHSKAIFIYPEYGYTGT
jgi:hypothetical protein